MGAWGEGPLDSDGALDWIGNNVVDPLNKRIERLFEDYDIHGSEVYAEDIRAAAAVVVRLNQLHPPHIYGGLIGRLYKIQDDERWLSTWTSDEAREGVRTSIDAQMRALKNIADSFQLHVSIN
jgi:hypothetical protein